MALEDFLPLPDSEDLALYGGSFSNLQGNLGGFYCQGFWIGIFPLHIAYDHGSW